MQPYSEIAQLPAIDYAARRQHLLAAMPMNSCAVIPSAREITRSRDTEFSFRQDSDFWYLTGFAEPDAWLLLHKASDGSSKQLLLCRDKDPLAEVWQGRRLGPDRCHAHLGIAGVSVSQLSEQLLSWVNGVSTVLWPLGLYNNVDEQLHQTLATLRLYPKRGYQAPHQLHDIRPLIAQQRLIKDEAEIAIMATAGAISARAHMRAMQSAARFQYEYQLEAEIRHQFAIEGARECAYNTIVGAGENGCILHYTENADRLHAGDLVLIDAGCELHGYAADITRTFPVNGRFSQAQAEIYQVVLNAQYAACAQVKPGHRMSDAVAAAHYELTKGLVALGILQGDLAQLLADNACKQYFIHGLGHWLGLDVHDVGAYKIDGHDRPFEPGMVLTIEPGLYIPAQSPCDEKYWGIAVRIEDNLLVIKDGHRNLTDTAVKEIADIEALMASSR